VLVLGISAALESARRAARKNQLARLTGRLWIGFGVALLFLAAQAHNWQVMGAATLSSPRPPLVVFGFFLLTGLHAAHVLGGLVPLSIVLAHARDREYSSSRHEGVSLCTDYWHFLAIVWVVLFVVLQAFR
jgi:cytochrome c oxidase subunit 3